MLHREARADYGAFLPTVPSWEPPCGKPPVVNRMGLHWTAKRLAAAEETDGEGTPTVAPLLVILIALALVSAWRRQ